MKRRTSHPPLRLTLCITAVCMLAALVIAAPAAAQGKDYLTSVEADKVRDAEVPEARIKLFVGFAEDRLTKFKYELNRGRNDRQRDARLEALLDAYMGCLEDAAELVEIGRMRQQDILKGIEELEKKATEYLAELETLHKAAPESAEYKSILYDAMLTTREALAEAKRGKEEIAPPPVRRKP